MDARYQFTFSRSMSPAEAVAKAQQVIAALSELPESQEPLPPVAQTLEELKTYVDTLQQALSQTAAGNRTQIPQRDTSLDQVVEMLNKVGAQVQVMAWNKAHLIPKAGFDMVKPRTSTGPLTASTNYTVKNDERPGMLIGKASPIRGAVSYEVYYTDGDPTVEENWKQYDVFGTVSRMEMAGLEQGKKYSFRMRAIGKNARGPWSHSVTTIVT